MREQPLAALCTCELWWEGGVGHYLPLSVLFVHHSACRSVSFSAPICLRVPPGMSLHVTPIVIHNECCCFYCALVWIIPEAEKSPTCSSQPECLDHPLPASLCMKTANYGPRLAQQLGFRGGPSAGNLGWMWIVSQMSSWINMAIYFQLQLESNCALLFTLSSSSRGESDSSLNQA